MRKDYFNLRAKSKLLLLTLLALFAGGMSPAWATELTIYESSTQTRSDLPFYLYNCDASGNQTEFVVPASVLTSMSGKNITGLKFYCTNNSFAWGTKTPSYKVYVKEVASITLSAFSGDTDAATVYTGTLSVDGNVFSITFTEPYEYSGGNLLIGTKVITTGTYIAKSNSTFYGDTSSDVQCARSSDGGSYFIPRTTFVYESSTINGPSMKVKDGNSNIKSGYSYNFGLALASTTKTFTLKNSGTEDCPVSVAHTGSFGAELSATSIPAGGEVTLTVTMPNASGSDEITISSTADGIDDFVINVSGSVKDPSKVWCDFSTGLPEGWTNKDSWTILTTGADGITTGGGYARNTAYGTNKLIYTPLLTIAEGEKICFAAKGNGATASWNVLKVQYSADGTNWTDAKDLTGITNTWQNIEVTEIPAGNWYIGFYGSYAYFTDIYGGEESSSPVLGLSQSSYDFGLITENTTSTSITISNTGKSALTGLNVVSSNDNFTVAIADNATSIAANGSVTFTVTMKGTATGYQNGIITFKSDNADDLVFTATGAVAKEGMPSETFDEGKPATWTNSSSPSWSFSDGKAVAPSGSWGVYATLTTPLLTVAADDFLAIKVKANSSSYGHLKVFTSTDGTTFDSTALKEVSYTELSTEDYTTIIVTGLTTSIKAVRFEGYQVTIDEISGLTYAPALQVKKGDDVQTTGTAHAFGELSANQTVTYNFTNAGAGTINITNVVSDNAVFTTNWTESTAAPFDLVITANYDAAKAGEQNGKVTVTTSEGTFEINLTSTFLAANAPKFALLVGETEQTTGADLGFGMITANTTKEFIIKNDGTGALNVTAITMPDEDYTTDLESAPTSEAPLVIAAGGSKTIKVTLAATAKAIKTGSIVISATGFDDFSFKADAYVLKDCETIDFNTAIPSTWENESNGWSIYNNEAAKCTGKKNLTSPKLTFAANDFFIFKVKASDSGSGDYVTVEGSADNGSTWTAFDKKTYSYSGDFGANTGDYSTIVVSGIPATCNKIRFNGYYVLIDEIAGLTYDANDPKISVFSNAEATASVSSGTAKDFGWSQTAQTATYYIKNTGTGTLTISNISEVEGFTVATAENAMTVAADADPLALTITMTNAAEGAKSGTITITTDGGNFEIPVSGFVYGDKNYIDFSATSQYAGWSMGSWTVTANTATAGSSSGTMQTTTMKVSAGEKLYVEAEGTSSSSYTTKALSYSFSSDNGETWSAAANLVASTTATIANQIFTISDIADAENETSVLIRFTGSYMAIKHIYGFEAVKVPHLSTTAADIAFGMQTAESDEQSFTITNDGTATLEGLSLTLGKTGENAQYELRMTKNAEAFTGTTLAAEESVTVYVKQLFDNNKLGAKSDVLTIAATDQTPVAINLTGATRDGSKLFVDFEDGNIPAGWTRSSSYFSVGTQTGGNYALSNYSSTVYSVTTTPLTVANNEVLTFDATRYYSSYSPTIKVRYTTDGGTTWSDYVNFSSEITSAYSGTTYKTLTLEGVPAGTVMLEFAGAYVRLDNISGFAPTTAPLLSLTEGSTAVANGSANEFGTLTAQATATYTLANNGTAAMVSTIATTGVATAAISGEGEGITIADNKVTLAAGKSATITLTLPYAAPYGEKTGAMTITTEGWVGDFTVNYTATTIDPTALNIDFASNAKPEGFYSNGWTYTSGYAANTSMNNVAEFITSKLTVAGTDDVLSFDARACYNDYGESLTVSYSTDRKDWTEATVLSQSDLTASYQTFQVSGLAAGNYYLKFAGKYVYVDNILGWHYATPVPEHDLYVASATLPTEAVVPGSEYTATVNVASLAAAETVKAELYFNINKVGELTEDAIIAKDETKTITITGNVPNEEGKDIAVYVKIYNDDVIVQTEPVAIDIAHTRTLKITEFKLAEGQEATAEADAANQFTAEFDVTVENTGTVELVPRVYIFNGETPVGYAIATDAVAVGNSTTLTITAQNMSAGEGGDLQFTAKAYWKDGDEPEFAYANPVTITVTAAAPKFDLAVKGGAAVTDGDDVAFGLVKEATTKTYTITNSGNKALELVSIVAPEGYEVTAVTDANKTIAIDGTLDIDVTLKAEQGKKSGDLVFTYKVDATTNNTFTLALSGRSVAADTWTETFDTEIPSAWTNNGWEWNSDRKAAYSTYSKGKLLMTPRLAAEKDEELTFDVIFPYSKEQLKVQYSTDKTTWNDVETYSSTANEQTFEGSFVAPAAGNYYLRFGDANSRYAYIDNLVGFKLNVPEHDTEIAAESVPTTGTQYAVYTATVTLKENAGKAEEVTAKLMVAGEEKATKAETITANGTTTITLTWTPDEVIADAVKAKITVKGTGIDLATEEVDLTVAAPYTLDETKSDEVVNDTYPALILKHTFVEGWNTVCLPFNIAVSKLHAEAVAFEFTSYDSTTKELTFTKRTDLVAGTPYVVYVPAAVTTDYVLNNVEITGFNTTAGSSTSTPVSFKGTYAPMTTGSLVNCFGLTAAGKIVKANASTTMKGFRGYFTGVPVGASARFIGFIDDELTGIRMITVDQNVEGVFNLQGQKIQQMKKGGLYIINGKKQVVK